LNELRNNPIYHKYIKKTESLPKINELTYINNSQKRSETNLKTEFNHLINKCDHYFDNSKYNLKSSLKKSLTIKSLV